MNGIKIIDGHICKGQLIRKYPSILCSLCQHGESIDVQMTEEKIDAYNQKFLNEMGEKNVSQPDTSTESSNQGNKPDNR